MSAVVLAAGIVWAVARGSQHLPLSVKAGVVVVSAAVSTVAALAIYHLSDVAARRKKLSRRLESVDLSIQSLQSKFNESAEQLNTLKEQLEGVLAGHPLLR